MYAIDTDGKATTDTSAHGKATTDTSAHGESFPLLSVLATSLQPAAHAH